MSTNSYRLYGAPRIFPGESISSWLQRLSQQQGVSIEKLFLLSGARVPKDVDSTAMSVGLSYLIVTCGFSLSNFAPMGAIARSIRKTKLLQKQVRADQKGQPVSAFCPACVANDRSPYYRVEWRFKFWEFCPKHFLPMATFCGKCRKEVALDRSILLSITPPPSLAYCKFCHSPLSHTDESLIVDVKNIDEKIAVQRGMMAGILNGYCMVAPFEKKFTLHVMMQLHQLGLLLPAMRVDFDKIIDHRQVIIWEEFLKKLQVRLQRKELMLDYASRLQRIRTMSRNDLIPPR